MPSIRRRSHRSRRPAVLVGALALVAALAVGGGLLYDSQRASADDYVSTYVKAGDTYVATPNADGAGFVYDFARQANGPLPTQLSGQNFSTFEVGKSESPLTVAAGALVHGAPTGRDAASYLEVARPAPVTRIGATATFPAGGVSGSIALVAWDNSIAESRNVRNVVPNGGIHFVATRSEWHIGVYATNGGESILAKGKYDGRADQPQAFNLVRDGARLTIQLPDGQTSVVTDPRIEQWTGPFATWELYEFDADRTPAAFTSIWSS